jgi:hypothetical protein
MQLMKSSNILFLCLAVLGSRTCAFTTPSSTFSYVHSQSHTCTGKSYALYALSEDTTNSEVAKEIQDLLARAKAIRESLPAETAIEPELSIKASELESTLSEEANKSSVGYRLHFDIGREDGTWMDPTWGRSGKRIEGSFDVSFQIPPMDNDQDINTDPSLADQDVISKMVKDNLSGKSTAVRSLDASPNARLRGGFDKMPCHGGGYRLDIAKRAATARFYLEVDGTENGEGNYGDIFVPKGCLYFSLPCFNNSVKQLSSREGVVTVRQMGWHTGWRREESRIVGVFRAVPIEQAKKRDKY